MKDRFLIRVEGATVSGVVVEKQGRDWILVIVDPITGSFSASGLKLEISKDNTNWYTVTEHELIALLVS